jgi:GAF domain-containing protein
MAALSQASIRLAGSQISQESLLETAINEARTVLGSDDITLWLAVENQDELELRVSTRPSEQIGRRLKKDEGISGQAFMSAKALRIDDYPRWMGRSRQLASSDIQTAMAIPLLWQGLAIGTLTLTRAQINRPFTLDEEQIAQLYAAQVASALENSRLLQETQDRVNELFTINQISQAIAAQTDLNALFDIMRQELTRALHTKSFYIAFYNEEGKTVELPYMYESGSVQAIPPFPLGPGFTSHIIETRQPLRINSADEARNYNPLQSGASAESYLGVPLLQRDQVLGVIAVQDTEKSYAYQEADVRLLSTIAGQVSLSIQNIRLLEQTRRRAEELTSLNRIANAIISVRDLEELLANAAREIVTVFKTRNCGIALIDATGQTATVVAEANRDPGDPSARGVVIPMEGNLSSQRVLETGKSLIVQNAQTDPLTESIHELMKERRTTALMIVPLLVRGKVIGTVGIDTDEPNRQFLAGELELAETLVAQVATAIDNNQLLEETRRRAEQLAAAAQISRAAISILDPNELIVSSANLIRERFDLYYVAIFLADEDNQWANLRYATGEAGQKLMAMHHRLGIGSQSMVGTAIASQSARIALDVGQEAVRFNNPYLPDTHSEMALPLVVAGRAIGALDVQSTRFSAFTQDDITVLQTLADQIAVALENGRLFARQKRATELEQLISTVSAKVTKTPAIQSIVENAATELGRSLGARKVVVKLRPASERESAGGNGQPADEITLN